jgi:hypothetical protein
MSRSSRDEREISNQDSLGRMVHSQGRSGGSVADDDGQKSKSRTSTSEGERAEGAQRDPDREVTVIRDRSYQISPRELALMTDIGKFRTVSVADIAEYRYGGKLEHLRNDVRALRTQKLISQRRVMVGKGREKFSVLVLTKEGKRVVAQDQSSRSGQAFYAGFVKPQEVAHDAAIYRMYHIEADTIQKQGGKIHRVVLDYELKRKVYSPLARARQSLPPLEYKRRRAEVAAENGLKVVHGKIPLPDLRVEYETPGGELTKVDLELATEHYHGRHAAEKLSAGFKTYADQASASRLNAALTYGRSAVYDGPELTAGILTL